MMISKRGGGASANGLPILKSRGDSTAAFAERWRVL